MEIPNPLAQISLVELCSAHWGTLQKVTARSSISLTRPVKKPARRSLARICEVENKAQVAVSRMPGGSVTLRTDISQFYGSIYTHAVDWAVRGKAAAKRAMRAHTLGVFLDSRLRESREGQTIGLSIGPDTSWLVSEVLLARVDEALCREHPTMAARAFRYIDDMTFYASSAGEAYDVLATYERLLGEYELSLNAEKVSVTDGLEPVESPWVGPLRQARFRDDRDSNQSQDLIDLSSLALEWARRHPTEGVLSYAVKRCNPFPAGKKSWPIYRDFVIAAVGQDGSVLRNAYEVLTFARAHGLPVDNDRLVEVLNALCATHARLNHGFEVSWILTLLRDLELPVDLDAAIEVSKMEDNTSLVLLYDAMKSDAKLFRSVNLDSAVRRAERKGALSTSDWLLAYEYRASKACRPNKWDDIIQWKDLNDAKVRFLVPKSKSRAASKLKRRRPLFLSAWGY